MDYSSNPKAYEPNSIYAEKYEKRLQGYLCISINACGFHEDRTKWEQHWTTKGVNLTACVSTDTEMQMARR